MAWSVPTKGFLCVVTSGFVTPLPSNTTYILPTDTSPTTRAVGGENITFSVAPERSGRDRNAANGKLAGMHFSESIGAGSTTYTFQVPAGTYRIRLAQGDPAGAQPGGQILVKDGATTLITLAGGASLNLFRDAAGNMHATAAAWLASNTAVDVTVAGTSLTVVCSHNYTTDDYWLSYIELEQLSETPIEPNLYLNGVGREDLVESGDSSALRALIDAAPANALIEIVQSLIPSATITFPASTWRFPAKNLRIRRRDLDTFHASGTEVTYAERTGLIKIASAASGSGPIYDMALAHPGLRWEGFWFYMDPSRGGNVGICTHPLEVGTWGDPAEQAYAPADQADNQIFDRCIFGPKVFNTGSCFFILHNGKRLERVDCLDYGIYATGGQGDGYASSGNVGVGPKIDRRTRSHNVGGENGSGSYGTHGWSSGGGAESDPPPYENFWTVQSIPMGQGIESHAHTVTSDLTKRRICWSASSHTIGTGSKTFTVPDSSAMTFTNGEAVTCAAGTIVGTSTSSVAIGTGSKSFTTQTGKAYANGDVVTVIDSTNGANTMVGTVTSYTSGTGAITINVTSVTGSGTIATWTLISYINLTGTITSYSGTSAVVNVTASQGSGTYADWTLERTDLPNERYKNRIELCSSFGASQSSPPGVLLNGWVIDRNWHDAGSQWHTLNFKLSTMKRTQLNYLGIGYIVIRNSIIRSIAQLYVIQKYVANTANPHTTDILLDNVLIYDVDVRKWGIPGNGGLIQLGTDMPANVKRRRTLIDCPTNLPTLGLYAFGDAGSAHHAVTQFAGFEEVGNIDLLPGTAGNEYFGYYGTGPTFAGTPAAFLDSACTGAVFTHNSRVTPSTAGYGTRDGSNTFYEGTGGRAALLAKLRNPTASDLNDRDYRYLAGQEEAGPGGVVRGPDYAAIYMAITDNGIAPGRWPLSWTPDLSSAARQPVNPVHIVRRFWPRQPPRR